MCTVSYLKGKVQISCMWEGLAQDAGQERDQIVSGCPDVIATEAICGLPSIEPHSPILSRHLLLLQQGILKWHGNVQGSVARAGLEL